MNVGEIISIFLFIILGGGFIIMIIGTAVNSISEANAQQEACQLIGYSKYARQSNFDACISYDGRFTFVLMECEGTWNVECQAYPITTKELYGVIK